MEDSIVRLDGLRLPDDCYRDGQGCLHVFLFALGYVCYIAAPLFKASAALLVLRRRHSC